MNTIGQILKRYQVTPGHTKHCSQESTQYAFRKVVAQLTIILILIHDSRLVV